MVGSPVEVNETSSQVVSVPGDPDGIVIAVAVIPTVGTVAALSSCFPV
jgi:hypothetical protein